MAEELHYVIEIKNSTDEQEESVQTTASLFSTLPVLTQTALRNWQFARSCLLPVT